MKNTNGNFLRVDLGLPFFVVFALGVSTVLAQAKLEPVPETIKAVEQRDSPIGVTIDGLNPNNTSDHQSFLYTIRNTTKKPVRAVVLVNADESPAKPMMLGLPGTMVSQLGYPRGLGTGASITLPYILERNDGIPNPVTLTVDFVLFWDWTTWGPDSLGAGERLIGIFEGQRKFVDEAKKLLASNDTDGLKTLISRDGPRPDHFNIKDATKRQSGVETGYYVAKSTLNQDLLGRGDLSGVPARLRDIEIDMGSADPPDDPQKQVTVHYRYIPPVAFTGISLDGRDISLDERFSADGDWLTGLRLKVRNDSGKTIKAAGLGIVFPDENGQIIGSSVQYGNLSPNYPLDRDGKEQEPRVGAGQTFEIAVGGKSPGYLKKILERRQSFELFSRVIIELNNVDFDDGTRWSQGQYLKPDPQNPKLWVPIKTDGH